MRKIAGVLLSFVFVFVLSAETFATDLGFNQKKYAATSKNVAEIYKVATKGFKGVALNSTKEEAVALAGEPDYQITTAGREFLFYFDYHSFKLVALQFMQGKLRYILFSMVSDNLKKVTRSELKHVFGKPEKKKKGQMIYRSDDKTKKVTFLRNKSAWMQEFEGVIIGNCSSRDMLAWMWASLKVFPRYRAHFS